MTLIRTQTVIARDGRERLESLQRHSRIQEARYALGRQERVRASPRDEEREMPAPREDGIGPQKRDTEMHGPLGTRGDEIDDVITKLRRLKPLLSATPGPNVSVTNPIVTKSRTAGDGQLAVDAGVDSHPEQAQATSRCRPLGRLRSGGLDVKCIPPLKIRGTGVQKLPLCREFGAQAETRLNEAVSQAEAGGTAVVGASETEERAREATEPQTAPTEPSFRRDGHRQPDFAVPGPAPNSGRTKSGLKILDKSRNAADAAMRDLSNERLYRAHAKMLKEKEAAEKVDKARRKAKLMRIFQAKQPPVHVSREQTAHVQQPMHESYRSGLSSPREVLTEGPVMEQINLNPAVTDIELPLCQTALMLQPIVAHCGTATVVSIGPHLTCQGKGGESRDAGQIETSVESATSAGPAGMETNTGSTNPPISQNEELLHVANEAQSPPSAAISVASEGNPGATGYNLWHRKDLIAVIDTLVDKVLMSEMMYVM